MAFRLINNKAQSISVKGFVLTLVLCLILHFTQVLTISITLPFTMPWLILWLVGYSMINKQDGENNSSDEA